MSISKISLFCAKRVISGMRFKKDGSHSGPMGSKNPNEDEKSRAEIFTNGRKQNIVVGKPRSATGSWQDYWWTRSEYRDSVVTRDDKCR